MHHKDLEEYKLKEKTPEPSKLKEKSKTPDPPKEKSRSPAPPVRQLTLVRCFRLDFFPHCIFGRGDVTNNLYVCV